MGKLFLGLIFLLISADSFSQQSLTSSRQTSDYTYVFRITGPEAALLFFSDMDKLKERYLYNLVDSFPEWQSSPSNLPQGNYLFAKVVKSRLAVESFISDDLVYTVVNNNLQLMLSLHDKRGELIKDATVFFNGHKGTYNPVTKTFEYNRHKKITRVTIVHEGVYHFTKLALNNRYEQRISVFNIIADAFPLKYIVTPIRKLIAHWKDEDYERYHRDSYSYKFKAFLVFSKPVYKPGDSLKVKAFIVHKNGSPVNRPLNLRLYTNNRSVDTILTTLSPYRPGAFESVFYLGDSLKIDRQYEVSLEEQGSSRHIKKIEEYDDYDDASRRKTLVKGSFKLEQYQLNSISFSARSDKKTNHRGTPVNVFLKAMDENDLPVLDGTVQIIVKPRYNGAISFTANSLFIPDTLLNRAISLDPIGETRYTIHDSIFPSADFEYSIECIFLNSSGERKNVTLEGQFDNQPSYISFSSESEGIRIRQFTGANEDSVEAMVHLFNEDDTIQAFQLKLPAVLPWHPYATRYEVETDSCYDEYEIKEEAAEINCTAIRDADSIHVSVNHKRKDFFWYMIMAGKRVIAKGYTDNLKWDEKSLTVKNYFVSIQFIARGKVVNREYAVVYQDKLLDIQVDQPAKVFPGEKTTIGLLVTDRKGNPVPDVDVTAYAITQKFQRVRAPYVPYLGKYYKNRIYRPSFFIDDENIENSASIVYDWEKWKSWAGLDTIEFFKFLHPESQYIKAEPAPENITQVAPFLVDKGNVVSVHQLYIDNIPVYFNQAGQMPVYSFRVNPGVHQIRFRTRHHSITIDSIFIQSGMKTFCSFLLDSVRNPRITIKAMPDTLTSYERNYWSRYMIKVVSPSSQPLSYIKQSGNTYVIGPYPFLKDSYNNFQQGILTGPYIPQKALFVGKYSFEQEFFPEGGYSYNIQPGLIKQLQISDGNTLFSKYLYGENSKWKLNDYVLTDEILDSLLDSYSQNNNRYDYGVSENGVRDKDRGLVRISIPDVDLKYKKSIFIRHIFLFRYDDTDFMESFSGVSRKLGYQQEGWYRLYILLRGDGFIIKDSIYVKRGGLNAFSLDKLDIRKPDSVSQKIAELLRKDWQSNTVEAQNKYSEEIISAFNGKYYSEGQASLNLTGKVVAERNGSPVSGASVMVKGTNIGTLTDANGSFSLRITKTATLVVAGVGFQEQQVRVNDNSFISIQLKESVNRLQEVVVTGLGVSRMAKSLGFSVSKIDATGSVLSGKASGVNIVLRGTSALKMTDAPLVYVDGIVFNGDMNKLDSSMIASVTVIKGKEAVDLFGDRALNGVIQISLKKPGGVRISEDDQRGFSEPSSIRRNFRDDAYWQPRLRTDGNGRVSFPVTFPDDVTKWRNFFIAINDKKQSGFAETQIRSYKTILANLSTPVFVVSGDSLEVTGKLLNYGSDSFSVKRIFTCNSNIEERIGVLHNTLLDRYKLFIPEQDSLKLSYVMQKADGYFDGEDRSIPVFKKGVLESKGLFLSLKKDTSFEFTTDTSLGKSTLYAEKSLLPVMLDEIEKIGKYEYLCNEQLASKLMALLLKEEIYRIQQKDFREKKNINELIRRLQKNSSDGGLWGWWSNNSPVNWVSLHVLDALLMAQEKGFTGSINTRVITDYLIYQLEREKGSARIDYLEMLSRLKENALVRDFLRDTTSYSSLSMHDRYRLLYLKQQQQMPVDVNFVLERKLVTPFGNYFWTDHSSGFTATDLQHTLLVYRILEKEGHHEPILENIRGYFLENRKNGQWPNTYEASSILKAILPAYLKEGEYGTPVLKVNGRLVTRFPFQTSDSSQSIKLDYQGRGTVYFTSHQERWNKEPKEVKSNFVITSHFEAGGDTIKVLKFGVPNTLVVDIDVIAASSYIMVEIPIPSACSYADKQTSYANNEVYREYFKNKVAVFCSSLTRGHHQFKVNLLPRTVGVCQLNPAKVEMMYFPLVFGREEMKRVVIK